MIFARGVRFIRFISSSVRGRASGSLSAAPCFSASVMASKRLQSVLAACACLRVILVVLPSFIWLCSTRRNDANDSLTYRIGYVQKSAVDHAQNTVTVFAVVLAVIQPLDCKHVVEDPDCGLKADAVLGVILGGFGQIPFKVITCHRYGLSVLGSSSLVGLTRPDRLNQLQPLQARVP